MFDGHLSFFGKVSVFEKEKVTKRTSLCILKKIYKIKMENTFLFGKTC